MTGASLYGGRMALKLTAAVPATMALHLPRHDPLLQDARAAIAPRNSISKHEEAVLMVGGVDGPAEY